MFLHFYAIDVLSPALDVPGHPRPCFKFAFCPLTLPAVTWIAGLLGDDEPLHDKGPRLDKLGDAPAALRQQDKPALVDGKQECSACHAWFVPDTARSEAIHKLVTVNGMGMCACDLECCPECWLKAARIGTCVCVSVYLSYMVPVSYTMSNLFAVRVFAIIVISCYFVLKMRS